MPIASSRPGRPYAHVKYAPAVFWNGMAVWLLVTVLGAGQPASGSAATQEDLRLDPQRASTPLSEIHGLPAPPSQPTRSLDQAPELRTLYERAREQLEDGNLAEALATLDAALQEADADYYELHYLLALAKSRVGRLGEARAAAESAARLRHGSADVHYLLGLLHRQQRQLEPAIKHLRTATLAAEREVNNPRVTAAWYRLGECLQQAGYLSAATEAYARFDQAVWETHPEHRGADEVASVLSAHPRGALELRLDLYRQLGRSQDAVRAAKRATDNRPEDHLLKRTYARVLLEAGEPDRAFEYCRERTQNWSNSRGLLSVAVAAAQAAGRLETWVADTERDIAADDQTEVASTLARHLSKAGAYAEAGRLWLALLNRNPNDAGLAWSLATTQRAAGNLPQAFETLCAFVRDHPAAGRVPYDRLSDWLDPDAVGQASNLPSGEMLRFIAERSRSGNQDFATDFVLGTLAAATRQALLAEKLFRSSLDARPDFAAAHVAWGHMLLSMYEWEQAKEHAAKALELAPDLAAAHFVLAEAQAGLDQDEDAAETYKAAVRLAPEDAAYPLGLARLHRRLGKDLSAQRYFHQVLTIDPSNAEAVEGLIESYLKGGKIELARAQLEQAEQLDVPEDALRRCGTAVQFWRAPFQQEHLAELARQFKRFPEDTLTGLQLAAGLFLHDQADEAYEAAEKVRAEAPEDDRLLSLLARLQMRRLEFEEAIKALEILVGRYPNRRDVLALLAPAYISDFRLAEARATLRRLLALQLDDDARRFHRAQLLDWCVRFAEFDGALELLEEWIEQEPSSDELIKTKLSILAQAGRSQEAFKLAGERVEETRGRLQPLVERAGDDAARQHYYRPLIDAYLEYLAVCMVAGDYQQAEQRARTWLDENPNDPDLTDILVEALLSDGRPTEAVTVVEEFTPQAWQAAIEARIWRARCLGAAGRVDDALAEFDALLDERLVRRDSGAVGAVRKLIMPVLVDAERYDQALERCEEWEAGLQPGTSAARLDLLGFKQVIFQAAGRVEEYTRVMESLLEHDPGDATLNNDLGYTWVDAGRNLERATQMIRRAVALDPLNPAYLDSLGWAYYKAADFASARKYLARVVRLRLGQDAVIYDHLADAEYRLGDREIAGQHWQKALELLEAQAAEQAAAKQAELMATIRAKLGALERSEQPAVAPTAAEQG
jgi:tetratricopeptide (TPR) repeat protein